MIGKNKLLWNVWHNDIHKKIANYIHESHLLVVRRSSVSAFSILVVQHGGRPFPVALLAAAFVGGVDVQQALHEASRVVRVHPIVPCGSSHQQRRIVRLTRNHISIIKFDHKSSHQNSKWFKKQLMPSKGPDCGTQNSSARIPNPISTIPSFKYSAIKCVTFEYLRFVRVAIFRHPRSAGYNQ